MTVTEPMAAFITRPRAHVVMPHRRVSDYEVA